jgi:integral membrane protein (TIGR01906 family)
VNGASRGGASHGPATPAARVGRLAETAAAALLWVALVVGAAVIALTLPVYTSAASQWLGIPQTAGLPAADVLRLSGQVRALVSERDYDPLPSTWEGEPAFDASAVSHLMDVREVLSGARLATGIAALLLAAYTGFCVVRGRMDRLRAGMLAGAVACVVAVALAAIVALTDFTTFFAGFHGLLFEGGTWVFPADSLLIRLFPERFWASSGAVWGLLVLAGAGALLLARRLSRTARTGLFPSRTGNSV